MKTAVSVPDDVFEQAERLAKRERRSRSEVYTAALREYVAKRSPDEVTASLDRVAAVVSPDADAFLGATARRTARSSEW